MGKTAKRKLAEMNGHVHCLRDCANTTCRANMSDTSDRSAPFAQYANFSDCDDYKAPRKPSRTKGDSTIAKNKAQMELFGGAA